MTVPIPTSPGGFAFVPLIGLAYTRLKWIVQCRSGPTQEQGNSMEKEDFLVIGSGIAGLVFALEAASTGHVRIVTKRTTDDTNTAYAQGGIAAAVGPDDDPDLHIEDTLACGVGICAEDAVRLIIEEGPAAVRRLAARQIPFGRHEDGSFRLGREGGHSRRRILHVHDATGAAVMDGLLAAVQAHPNIEILSDHCAVDLIVEGKDGPPETRRCVGAYILDAESKTIEPIGARVTLLATGGTGKAYRYTSNPDVATGDGVAMGYRAGCRIANLEFVQFHPTCLYHPQAKDFLITEAVRGKEPISRRWRETGSRFRILWETWLRAISSRAPSTRP